MGAHAHLGRAGAVLGLVILKHAHRDEEREGDEGVRVARRRDELEHLGEHEVRGRVRGRVRVGVRRRVRVRVRVRVSVIW